MQGGLLFTCLYLQRSYVKIRSHSQAPGLRTLMHLFGRYNWLRWGELDGNWRSTEKLLECWWCSVFYLGAGYTMVSGYENSSSYSALRHALFSMDGMLQQQKKEIFKSHLCLEFTLVYSFDLCFSRILGKNKSISVSKYGKRRL